ncbi:MAG TPA: hypothetical protein VGH80_10860 [Xanthomonadaceae bacterium]|jgi:hypothetical protein
MDQDNYRAGSRPPATGKNESNRQQKAVFTVVGFAFVFGCAILAKLFIAHQVATIRQQQLVLARQAAVHAATTLQQVQLDSEKRMIELQHARIPKPLPTGYRCIGKQLFHELPNGFEQVTDGSAALYCR